MYIYQRLKDTREDLDKKQEDIAFVLNIQDSNISFMKAESVK